MKILFLSQLFCLPLDSGSKIKTYHTLRALSQKHEVTFISFVRRAQELEYLPQLEAFCHEVKICHLPRSKYRDAAVLASAMARRRSFIIERDFNPQMQSLVEETLCEERFDAIHIDRLQMAQYLQGIESAALVLDQHNVESDIVAALARYSRGPKRFVLAEEFRKLRRLEARIASRFDHIFCVSENDRTRLERLLRDKVAHLPLPPALHVVPIGIDCAAFRPTDAPRQPHRMLFIGPLNWPPNADAAAWFVRYIWPQIHRYLPQATLRIVGAHAPRSLRRLCKAPAVELAGYVNDAATEMQQAEMLVVPLRAGSGVRVKILNAMAAGLPVVSTSIGCEGLDAAAGKELLVADTADGFAQAVISLSQDRLLQQNLSAAGRRFVEYHHDLHVMERSLLAIYECLEDRRKVAAEIIA